MHRYVETVEILQREPTKWLARKNVRHIRMFFAGFLWTDVIGAENVQRLVPLINGFSAFLARNYGDSYLDYSEEVALSQAGYDDDESFELYFRQWRAFYGEWKQRAGLSLLEVAPVSTVDLSGLLNHIQRKPGYWMTEASVEMLYSLVRGVQRSCQCYAPGARVQPDFDVYEAWLCAQSPLKKRCRWDRLLLAESFFDDENARARFFATIEQFRKTATAGTS